MPKTGTSAIQSFMVRNRELLLKNGLAYPSFDIEYDEADDNRNGRYIYLYYEKDEVADTCISRTTEAFQNADRVLLSDEGLFLYFIKHPDVLERFAARYAEKGIAVKIIVYLRRQDDYIRSKWAQVVKTSERYTFDEFLAQYHNYETLDYLKSLDELAGIKGVDELIVRVYGRTDLYQGNGQSLISDFLSIFDMPLTPDYEKPDRIVNTSLVDKYLEVKRRLNMIPEFGVKGSKVVKYLRKLQEKDEHLGEMQRPAFSLKARREFLAQYDGSNRAVAQKYFQMPEGSTLFPEPDRDEPDTPFSEEEIAEVLGRVILLMEDEKKKAAEKLHGKKPLPKRIAGKIGKKLVKWGDK